MYQVFIRLMLQRQRQQCKSMVMLQKLSQTHSLIRPLTLTLDARSGYSLRKCKYITSLRHLKLLRPDLGCFIAGCFKLSLFLELMIK